MLKNSSNKLFVSSYGKILQPIDPDARDFIDQLNTDPNGVHLTAVQRRAVDFLVRGLKGIKDTGISGSVWERNKTNGAAYPIIGGTEYKHKFNLFNPIDSDSAFRLSYLGGGWIHNNLGAKPNGTTSYADTFFIPSASASDTSVHFCHYTTDNAIAGTTYVMGCQTNTTPINAIFALSRRSDTIGQFVANNYSNAETTSLSIPTRNKGVLLSTLTSSTQSNLFLNGIPLDNITTSSRASVLPNIPVYIAASNRYGSPNYFSPLSNQFISIGTGLSNIESILYSRLVMIIQQILNRSAI